MIEINLLGESSKKDKGISKGKFIFELPNYISFAIAIIIVEIVALIYITYSMNGVIDKLQSEKNNLSTIERQVKRIRVKVREVNNMIKAVKSLEKGRSRAAKILEEVADAIPHAFLNLNSNISPSNGGLWLVRLSKKGRIVSVEGKSFTAEAVADYMMRLEALKDVKKVRFSSGGLRKISSSNGLDVYAFSIIVTLKG